MYLRNLRSLLGVPTMTDQPAHYWVCVSCHELVAASEGVEAGAITHDTYCNPCGITCGAYSVPDDWLPAVQVLRQRYRA